MDSSAPLMAQHGNEHEPTLAALQRAAARRGLDVEHRPPHFIVRLKDSQAAIYRTRRPEFAREFVDSFRGSRR